LCFQNIGITAHQQMNGLERVYQKTWLTEEYNFDKENFSALKVDFFVRHFHVAFVYRSFENVLPPSRLRVWAWYDAIYTAIYGKTDLTPRALAERAKMAWQFCWDEMQYKATQYDLPVIDYDLLCTAPSEQKVIDHLARGWIGANVDVPAAVAEIMRTRRYETKTPHVELVHNTPAVA